VQRHVHLGLGCLFRNNKNPAFERGFGPFQKRFQGHRNRSAV
jgi:hypothetical protein